MNSAIHNRPAITVTSPHPSLLFPELQACKTMRDLKQVHAKSIKTGLIRDPLVAAELLRFCAVSDLPIRELHYARLIFNQMDRPNCFSWNTFIRALSESDSCEDVFESLILFCLMLHDDSVETNRFTFPSVLKACAAIGRLEEGRQIHGMILKHGLEDDEFVLSNLVRMYALCACMADAYLLFNAGIVKQKMKMQLDNVVLWNVMIDGMVRVGEFGDARKLFDEMPVRSVVSWNSMVSAYAKNGFFREAIVLFQEMQLGGVSPNHVTLVSVLPAISRLGWLEMGKWVHLYAVRNYIEIDEVLGSALIDMYSKCGSIEEALHVFEFLPRKNVITWNSIISGLAMHSRAKDALDYFWIMVQEGMSPSDVTYIGVLSACSHAGLVQSGQLIFNHMVKIHGLEPRIEHFGCMVDLFGRAGLLKEAEEFILKMPIEPDDVILKALVGACKTRGNLEMGERVAKRLMEMAPLDSGSYVALSNMYASAGNWDRVAEMRLLMKEMDIRKDPGCSWLEIDGVIHEFLVEDDSHPRAKEIHEMLEEMNAQLNLVAYRPDISQVFLNMDDQDKESCLQQHSEKIAVAFGLISTSPGTTLRIVKNIRICDDCHSSLKLVSKIFKRKIIVRDRKRFHHFEGGACSCMDYW